MPESALDLIRVLLNPERLLELMRGAFQAGYGYGLVAAIVFAETGLLLGFFLPGDSLLFTVGLLAGAGAADLTTVILLLSVAAIVGDAVGYQIGRQAGVAVYNRPDSRLFRQSHLQRTKEFYEKHGGKTIIYARFVPIVRTFAPFIAGVAQMRYSRFLSFNVFGGIGWVVSMSLAGYFLGQNAFVRRHFEKVVILIVLVSVLPIVFEYLKARRRA